MLGTHKSSEAPPCRPRTAFTERLTLSVRITQKAPTVDHHEQIPVWGLINFQFLYQVHLAQSEGRANSATVNQLVDAASKHVGCSLPLAEFWSPVNAETVFSFLYSIIVVPKELFSGQSDAFFENFRIDHAEVFRRVDSGSERLGTTLKVIRFLRNSVSHVNYRVVSTDAILVSMWNKNRYGVKDIKVLTDINLLTNFGVRFAKHYADFQAKNKRVEGNG